MEDVSLNQLYDVLNRRSNLTFGQFLSEKLEERGVSANLFAEIIGVGRLSLQRILKDQAEKIDSLTLLRISDFLGVDLNMLMNVLSATAIDENEAKSLERARKAGIITEYFDLPRLKKVGFIKDARNFDAIEERILKFFGLSSLSEYKSLHQLPLFSRTRGKKSDKMLIFWLTIVHERMRSVKNPNTFDPDRLERIIPLFRAATTDVADGFKRAVRTLYDCGVTVIVESYLSTTSIRGGTFLYNNKPYIFLTKHPNYYDTLWFALLHELGHVMFDLEIIRKGSGSHLSGENSFFEDPLLERSADEFATEMLLTKERLDQVERIIHVDGFVKRAADDWNVHPSIIYGMYCFKHPQYFPRYAHHRFKADEAIKFTNNSWETETLQETVPLIESQLIATH